MHGPIISKNKHIGTWYLTGAARWEMRKSNSIPKYKKAEYSQGDQIYSFGDLPLITLTVCLLLKTYRTKSKLSQ